MSTISLTLPVSATVITAGLHSTNYTIIQNAINGGLDNNNFASGKIFAPSKLMQESAADGDGLAWDNSSSLWKRTSDKKMRPLGIDWALQPTARVYHSANQSINNATVTTLNFDSERFDTDTIHDTATNNSRLTCKTAGKYMINAHVAWAAGGGSYRRVRIRVNGTALIAFQSSVTAVGSENSIATLYDLAVNDYVEVQVDQDSGGALNVTANANYSPEFSMIRVG